MLYWTEAGWRAGDKSSLMNVESMNVNIDDCDMRMIFMLERTIKQYTRYSQESTAGGKSWIESVNIV